MDNIKHISLFFAPVNSDAALIYKTPLLAEQGRFSAEYILALILLGIPIDFQQFGATPIAENIQKLMQKMQRSYDIQLPPHPDAYNKRYVVIEIVFDNNQKISQRIDVPKGSPKNPYSQQELAAKLFTALQNDVKAQQLLTDIHALANGMDIKQLLLSHWQTL